MSGFLRDDVLRPKLAVFSLALSAALSVLASASSGVLVIISSVFVVAAGSLAYFRVSWLASRSGIVVNMTDHSGLPSVVKAAVCGSSLVFVT